MTIRLKSLCFAVILMSVSVASLARPLGITEGFRVYLDGRITCSGCSGGEVAIAEAVSNRVVARTMSGADGRFAFVNLRLLPGLYLIAGMAEEGNWQAAESLTIGPDSFNKRFTVLLQLQRVPTNDIDLGGFPLHFGVHQFFATCRDLTSHLPTAIRSSLSFGHRDVALPINDSVRPIYGSPKPLASPAFVDSLLSDLRTATTKEILLYVHGYNNTFDDAALSSALLRHGTSFDGVSLFFSWPSRGRLLAYWTDEREAARSTDDLEALLRLILTTRASKVNIVAHSMGSRIVTEALARLAADPRIAGATRPFGNVVLAAADIAPDTLRARIPGILKIADRVTIYYSRNDRATAASKVVHDTKVVGHDGINYASEAVDVIDATYTSTSLIAHSYIEERPVLNDVYALLHYNKPAAMRPLIPFDDFYRIAPLACNR